MFEVFLYLLENYAGIDQCPEAPLLARRLASVGFEEHEVRSAVLWVELLRMPLEIAVIGAQRNASTRVYHESERAQLGDANIDLLAQLEINRSIDAAQREVIIERVMMLPHPVRDEGAFKALLLTVLWAGEHEIDDVLLHGLIDQMGDETLH